jgi:hypothetical protein
MERTGGLRRSSSRLAEVVRAADLQRALSQPADTLKRHLKVPPPSIFQIKFMIDRFLTSQSRRPL